MNKIIKHYSQAQAWHDPDKWKPSANKPFVVIYSTYSNSDCYEYAVADHLEQPRDFEANVPTADTPSVFSFYNKVCNWGQVIRWAYLDDLLPLDLKGKLVDTFYYDEDE